MDVLAALQPFDEAVLRAAHGTPALLVPLFAVITVVGGGWGLIGLVPFLARRPTRRTTLWLLGAVTVTSGLVSLFKHLIGRPRPCDALGWCPSLAFASPGGFSFPSGHAAGAFAFATFLSLRTPRHAPGLALFAALVAWSRCVLGVHYPSDVLAGSLLGVIVGAAFARLSTRAPAPLRSAPPSRATCPR